MDLGDRIGWLILGCLIGFVLGYIARSLRDIKEELDEVDELVKHVSGADNEQAEARKKEWWQRRLRGPDFALLAVVVITAYAAFMSQSASNDSKNASDLGVKTALDVKKNYEADQLARCKGGTESRDVQRETVDAIYELATGSLKRDASSPPLTATEVKQYNAYIDRVNAFREQMYRKIQPSKACAPYVEDVSMEPPGKPYPHFTK